MWRNKKCKDTLINKKMSENELSPKWIVCRNTEWWYMIIEWEKIEKQLYKSDRWYSEDIVSIDWLFYLTWRNYVYGWQLKVAWPFSTLNVALLASKKIEIDMDMSWRFREIFIRW